MRDRVMASCMGVFAVDRLCNGESNIVICERHGEIVATDINYALILDRMYKNKLKDGDLAPFSEETLAKMRAEVEEKRCKMKRLYDIANRINL